MSKHEKGESTLPPVRNDAVQAARFQPPEGEVRVRAYEKYATRNGGPGDDIADWLEAEREFVEERGHRPVRNQ